ncbi:hypothetical protein A2318_01555 [Candidatus Uhrbacteria bacterium RIFOXYB2_FULL_45_11]|uniref:Uncharacterized protein n=1 Tax=Candidatus Uhrbacteria bacterium RIFOXYB2_FULL_45_11 TaxID=1802421 RepID=A0A1F7WC39_9BACT|nr:MAG: hypothetical protein A2318_01555 [Candidatus Uhrbacteria bacterium RIFOXYB2_FULL_45_11]
MVRSVLKTKKSAESFLIPILFGLFAASFFVVFARAPEQVIGVSSDRALRAEGVSYEATALHILRLTNVEQSIPRMRSPVYELSVRDGGILNESVIRYRIPKELRSAPPHLLTFIVFDTKTLSWTSIPTTIDEKKEVASATVPIHQVLMIGLGTIF